jgi:saccharopine dehydrogenase-like NADP-dependent oxidoreductase
MRILTNTHMHKTYLGKFYGVMDIALTQIMFSIFPQTAYVDVCDDTTYAWRAKSFKSRAVAANVPAITTGGIYPGVSNGYATFILCVKDENLLLYATGVLNDKY